MLLHIYATYVDCPHLQMYTHTTELPARTKLKYKDGLYQEPKALPNRRSSIKETSTTKVFDGFEAKCSILSSLLLHKL
jgi:hypothetical protein